MLKYESLFGQIDKIKEAIQFLKDLEPQEGYYLAFSGGKDSIVIKKLAELARVKFDSFYNVTTIDPPDLIYFIRKYHKDVKWNRPEKPLLKKMIDKRFPPLRMQRWCCEIYKESGGSGRRVITGIRKAESLKRSKRKLVEFCFRDNTKQYINPIINWSDAEIWEFIKLYKLPYCNLYDRGFKRIGCLFCPMAGKHRLIEAAMYPNYVNLFIKAFQELYDYRKKNGLKLRNWKNGEDFFYWWLCEPKINQEKFYDSKVLFE